MSQELKKNIKVAVFSEYKLMICILAMLIVFWKIINTLISESIVSITETVADNNMIVAFIFFLCPVFIAFIRFDSLKSEAKIFSQRHLWELFLLIIYLIFELSGNFDFYSFWGINYFTYSFIGLLITELGLYCIYRKRYKLLADLYEKTHPFFIDAPTTDDSYDRGKFLKTLLDKILSTFDNRFFVENPNAFTILLSESFGKGKTSFLFQIKKAIREEEYKNKIIYVEFRPWLCEKSEMIITEFFSTLNRELAKHFVLPKGLFSRRVNQQVQNYYIFL